MEFPIKLMRAVLMGAGFLAGVANAQLSITNISNAASYIYAPLPNSSIAQGSFFVILASGNAASSATADWASYPLPTTLDGTSVSVTVGGTTAAALIYYVGPSQINAVMPSSMPTGTGAVVLTQDGSSSSPFPVTVVAASPGTLSLNGAGTGPGVFYNVAADGSMVQNNLFRTAKPGQFVALFGTGLGPAADASQEGQQAPAQVDVRTRDFLVDVWVGNQQATVEYAGRSSYTAEDEIDFTVPNGVTGCYNEVAVYVGAPGGQTVSNFTTLAIDPAGAACQDADGINVNDLGAAIDSKGSVNVGAISLLSNYVNLDISLIGQLQWDNDTVNGEIVELTTQQLNASLGFASFPSVNSCVVSPFLQYPPPTDPVLGGVFGPVVNLNAGASLSIQGPNGTKPVPMNPNGDGYSALVGGATISQLLTGSGEPPFFLTQTFAISPGSYTVTGPGGSNVGAFSATIPVSAAAAAFEWTNQASVTGNPIPRNAPLTITWTGGDPSGFVEILADASTLESGFTPGPTTPGAQLECIAPASAGTFTIPVYVLEALPSTAASTSVFPAGLLMVGPASGAMKFHALPTGLDAAYLLYHYVAGANVAWQ